MAEDKTLAEAKKPEDRAAFWMDEIKAAGERTEKLIEEWRKNVSAFIGKPFDFAPADDEVYVNKDWPRAKQKQSQLFFHVPEVVLKPKNPDTAPAVPVFSAVINHKLKHDIRADVMADECLSDVLISSGIGCSKIGYRAITQKVKTFEQDVQGMDPAVLQAALQAGTIKEIEVEVPIHKEFWWKRFSPTKLLVPADFHGSDYDDAPWLGMKFRKPLEHAIAEYGLPDSFAKTTNRDEDLLSNDPKQQSKSPRTPHVEGYEIWYKAHLYDPKVKHPQLLRRVVLIDGHPTPVKEEDSPYQRFDPNTGKVLGQKRFPIRVLALTYVPDSAFVPSDTTISRPQVAELSLSRTQMLQQRKRSVPMRWADRNRIDPSVKTKLEAGEVQDIILTDGPGDNIIGEIAKANFPRENFEFDGVVQRDLDEQWAMGGPQLGIETSGETTAEEIRTMQGNVNARLDYERNKVMRWFAQGAELVGDLLQLFADEQDFVYVAGQNGVQALQAWDRNSICGEYVYEVKPDTAVRIDVDAERTQTLKLYQMLANEPFVDRQKLVSHVLQVHNIDPASVQAPPPEPGPEKPNVSYRFNGQDLLNPMALAVLQKSGVQITSQDIQGAMALIQSAMGVMPPAPPEMGGPPPEEGMEGDMGAESDMDMGQPPHGGPAEQAVPLSKHQLDSSGGM